MRLNGNEVNKLPWRKLLYVKQDYPDNYVDDTFLDELQKNGKLPLTQISALTSWAKSNFNLVNVRSYDYWTTVYESGVIVQHISSIVIFIAVFIHLEQQKLATNTLIIIGTLMTALGYVFWDYSVVQLVPSYALKSLYIWYGNAIIQDWYIDDIFENIGKKTAKGALFFFATLLGLSPILRTLTLKTSDDSIYAFTVCLFIVNVLSHDYSAGNRHTIK